RGRRGPVGCSGRRELGLGWTETVERGCWCRGWFGRARCGSARAVVPVQFPPVSALVPDPAALAATGRQRRSGRGGSRRRWCLALIGVIAQPAAIHIAGDLDVELVGRF